MIRPNPINQYGSILIALLASIPLKKLNNILKKCVPADIMIPTLETNWPERVYRSLDEIVHLQNIQNLFKKCMIVYKKFKDENEMEDVYSPVEIKGVVKEKMVI